jgi:hypothetical protein
VALFALATGRITAWTTGAWGQHELVLFQQLWEHLRAGELLLADRGFCSWGLLAQGQARHVHAVFRVRGSRRRDLRQGKALGPGERQVQWRKPSQRPRTVSPEEWDRLPEFLCLRLVRCRFDVPGFRTREVLLVTTLLDRQRYSLRALAALYRRRWEMELTLRHLKITLQMDQLSCKTSPAKSVSISWSTTSPGASCSKPPAAMASPSTASVSPAPWRPVAAAAKPYSRPVPKDSVRNSSTNCFA